MRADVSAVDVLMMVKGVCEAVSSFQHVNPDVALRQLDLIRSAISMPGTAPALRGAPPTIDDLEQAAPPAPKPRQAATG
jgi:hypothetical protein